jgi:hypothetical protein
VLEQAIAGAASPELHSQSQVDDGADALSAVVGQSAAMQEEKETLRSLSRYSINLPLTGPTGTGKSFLSRTDPGDEVPKDFPDDIPIYPGAETVSAVWHLDRGAGSAQLTSTDSPETVAEWYRERLPEEEWTLGSSEGSSGGIPLPAWKDQSQLMVSLEADGPEGGTSIHLNITRG